MKITPAGINDSNNPAYGRWTNAAYLSADNAWDLGDKLLGKVDHRGGLLVNGSYSGTLKATLPPLKQVAWVERERNPGYLLNIADLPAAQSAKPPAPTSP